jgi:sporulation protein YlmC with PRC-barrel domain
MHATWKFALTAFAAAAAMCFSAAAVFSPARADEPRNEKFAKDEVKVAIAHIFRTADIIGLPVLNKQGQNVGKLDDLVINMKNGEVQYAALTHGGVAGIGSKLFAVPFTKMTFVMGEPNNRNARHFVFDVTNEQLDKMEGFDSSHWPNVADPAWGAAIDKHFNFERKHEAAASDSTGPSVKFETVFRASKIKGMDVRNEANENLGSVDELVVDITKGHVKYMVLSFGSFFTTGNNKLFAVPLSHCTLTHANDKTFIQIKHVTPEQLKNAPGFVKDHWPDTANPNWAKEIDTFYERTATRPAIRQ